MLSKIMKRAHQLAKKMEGDYTARLSISLRQAWKEAKEMSEVKLPELIGTQKQVKWAEDIRKDVLETLNRCWEIIKKEGKEGEYQRHYDRLVTQIETSEYALEIIDKFKSISYKEHDMDRIDVLKRGFRSRTRLFNFAQNKMF